MLIYAHTCVYSFRFLMNEYSSVSVGLFSDLTEAMRSGGPAEINSGWGNPAPFELRTSALSERRNN